MNAVQHHILGIVQTMNHNWLSGEFDHLNRHLHPNVVFVNTEGAVRVKGRQAYVDAFRNFVQHVHTQNYTFQDEKVELWDKTAVASYEFAMSYRLAGRDFQKKGREVVVFNRDGDDWRVVYRTLSPY